MRSIFFFIIVSVIVLNLLLLAMQISWLRRRQPWPSRIGIAVCLWTFLMLGLFFLQAFVPVAWETFFRHWFYLPFSTEMVWNLIMLPLLFLVAVVVTVALRWLRPAKRSPVLLAPTELSRRKFIYLLACGAAPATALGMGVHGSLTRDDLRVRHFDIPLANLPPELEGFSIAHVSDLHSGIFCGPRRLKIISSATNDLKADLIAITGDIINHSMAEFPDALASMQRLRAPSGIFLCEGNHDVIPGPGLIARACRENDLPLLLNQTTIIPIEGRRLIIAGLPWLGGGFEGSPEIVRQLYPEREEGDVRILMAHHPDLFDLAESTDLVLAGHTHGGQIMVGPVGLGPLFFKYWSGRYQRKTSTMIVSNGCGDWFPCRVGAPAEVALLRLTKAQS
jgi:predicted MPP superfamily phosphohydrolase